MDISVAYLSNDNKIYLYTSDEGQKKISCSESSFETFATLSFQFMIYDSQINFEEKGIDIKFEQKFIPSFSNELLNINKSSLDQLSYDEFMKLYEQNHQRFNLANNILTIEEIVPIIQSLKDQWKNDRHLFFTELWYLLKSNLNTKDLNIIFNDIKQNESEDDKAKLIKSYISGTRSPEILPGAEREAFLMKEYEADFESPVNIEHFIPEKGELVCAALINHSPLIIMAKLSTFNQLQKAIIVAIFTGLQD